jgi:hypothetical protein
VCAVLQQHLLLNKRGLKPEPHAKTLPAATDKRRRERRFLPGMNARVFTPRIG